ncbi:MAG TPA: efflux RND transporter periplasmic adaptor subunit, partial [Rhodanobacteraceae bacterium]|nr:efflux RND transporter periplasmic adaptor subunit [Rhodanobacteraceae bacterium]
WQPSIATIGTVRAAQGADLALDVAGIVDKVLVQSGADVKAGQVLLELRAADDTAALNQARAALALAQVTYERVKKQLATKTIARATYDNAAADLKVKQANVAQLSAVLDKKQLRAPFDGRLGIITVSPGAYLNSGTKVVTLQQLDPVFVDFTLPQKQLEQARIGATVHAHFDGLGGQAFSGQLTAVDPRLDTATRNARVEARFDNPKAEMLPGMFAHLEIDSGKVEQHLTLPLTSIAYNPYGATVYVVEKGAGKDKDGKPIDIVTQTFVTPGATRGDQVAVVKGLKAGDLVVTSGQLKLKNGTPVLIDNSVVPSNDANPTPQEQ